MKPWFYVCMFVVGLFIGTIFAQVSETNRARTPRNEHAAKLRRMAQQANQLANEVDPPPLPPAPANAVAMSATPFAMPSPMPVVAFRTAHPSGAIIEVTMPTNMVAIEIPKGYYLTNRTVRDITLDEFNGFKETNAEAMVLYFARP